MIGDYMTTILINNRELPMWSQKDTICPYRHWMQTECYNCDFCGRNEAYEHGASYDTIDVNGFEFFTDAISNVQKHHNIVSFDYGHNKKVEIQNMDQKEYEKIQHY